MTKLHRTTCILGLCTAAIVGCAATNQWAPPADCSPVDEAWIDTAPRCGEGRLYYRSTRPMARDCQVVDGNFEYTYAPYTEVSEFTQYRGVLGRMSFHGTTNLISGFRNIEHMGQFTIGSAPVTNLRGLDNLRVVTASFTVRYMPLLTSLEGLEGLRSVGGYLLIEGNQRLTSLRGLSSLCSVGGNVQITDNPMLPQSEIDAFLAHVEVGGEVTVTNPGP